jgi:hypothetical protein
MALFGINTSRGEDAAPQNSPKEAGLRQGCS